MSEHDPRGLSRDEKLSFCDDQSMGRTPPQQAALLLLLEDADPGVRCAAADAIGHIGPPAYDWRMLDRLLVDQTQPDFVRDTCAYALGAIDARHDEVVEDLKSVARETEGNARIVAREVLVSWGEMTP